MSDYPLPHHAASIWIAGDILWLAFPPTAGHTRGHTIHLPADSYGMLCAVKILRERESAPGAKLDQSPGTPSSSLANEMLKALKSNSPAKFESADRKRREKEEAAAFLASLGL